MTIADYEEQWDDARIIEIENSLLQGILGCRTTESVEAAITYAKFLSSIGITSENYPVFLKMLEIENHWVIDSLIGERDPFLMLSPDTHASPESGSNIPVNSRMVVVFPAPSGPTRPKISPSSISSCKLSTAMTESNLFVSLSALIVTIFTLLYIRLLACRA